EGGGDPVVAEGEMSEAEQPAEPDGALRIGRFGQQRGEPGHCQHRQRPQPERLEPRRSEEAECQRRQARTRCNNLPETTHYGSVSPLSFSRKRQLSASSVSWSPSSA